MGAPASPRPSSPRLSSARPASTRPASARSASARDEVRSNVVVVGLGDTGLLTAMQLSKTCDVLAISTKPEFLSGQELGLRLADPAAWQRDYRFGFGQFRRLRGVQWRQGQVTSVDFARQVLEWRDVDDVAHAESYDFVVFATGVTNGFWRTAEVTTSGGIDEDLARAHQRLEQAERIAVIGGGAAAVATCAQVLLAWPGKACALYFPGERALTQHHPRVWDAAQQRLLALGATLHPGHRAVLPEQVSEIGQGELNFSSGQAPVQADAIVYAVGKVVPNTGFLTAEVLDEAGFIQVRPTLQLPEVDTAFAVGDVASSDPLRTSARNQGHLIVAKNIAALRGGRALVRYRPPRGRWGSVFGFEPRGLVVFTPQGRGVRIPRKVVDVVLQPWIVRRGIYGGIDG